MAELEDVHQWDLTQRLQIAIGPLILLLFLYYGHLHLASETTIQRTIYELSVRSVPEPLWRLMQRIAFRMNGPFSFPETDSENTHNKSGTLKKTGTGQGFPSVVQTARRFSGLDRFINPAAEYTFPGLGNWDNSCFQNSVLQALASLSAFTSSIDREWHTCVAVGTEAPLIDGLRAFLGQLQEGIQGRRTIWPPSVLRSMNTWQQQDAQEYLSKILDSVEKEVTKAQRIMTKRARPGLGCLRPTAPTTKQKGDKEGMHIGTGILSDTQWELPSSLDGSLSQKLRCQKCGFSEGLSLTSFNCLTLSLGMGGGCDLESLLDAYFDPELIDGVECDECTRLASQDHNEKEQHNTKAMTNQPAGSPENPKKTPKILSTKAKHVLFGRLPSNLAFHINRSIFDDWGNQRKNNSYIAFPPVLKIWSDWVESFGEGDPEVHAVYELRCIINHSGRHDNGHYVACGKRGKDWFLFNDEIVTRTNESDVLARGNVFMLFYEKVDCAPILGLSTPKSERSQAGSPELLVTNPPYKQEPATIAIDIASMPVDSTAVQKVHLGTDQSA